MHFRHSAKEGTGSSHRIQVNLLRKKILQEVLQKAGKRGRKKTGRGSDIEMGFSSVSDEITPQAPGFVSSLPLAFFFERTFLPRTRR